MKPTVNAMTYMRSMMMRTCEYLFAVMALGSFFTYMGFWEVYAHNRPTIASESIGRIYPLNNHGVVVYLTASEKLHMDAFLWAAVPLFLIAVLIDVYMRRSDKMSRKNATRLDV
jgi:hypothetical protein